MEAGKSKIKVQGDFLFDESLLPGSQTALFFLSPYMVGGGWGILWDLFYKDANPIQEDSVFLT